MSRRREPDRNELPPEFPVQAELGQSKAFEDRLQAGPPAADYVRVNEDTARRVDTPSDQTPANDTDW